MALEARLLLQALSQALGWTYFLLWSVSLYPQVIHNYRRRATTGFSLDFSLLNVLGLCAYTVFNSGLLFSSVIRAQYAQRHSLSPEPPVHLNDFFYALHGTAVCLLLYTQLQWPALWRFDTKREQQRPSRVTLVLVGACLGLVILDVIAVLYSPPLYSREWLDVLYTVGNIKLFLTVIKYTPQVWLNYCRQSTHGFCMSAILMDFTGGMLSLIQLVIDTSLQGDWSGTRGNIPKLLLGNITIFFDVVIMVQHYCLYPRKSRRASLQPSEHNPLLS
ncbi:putative L-cystine transporter [Aspergillus clavatus NRRL 1]|uniref:L-cystine transporter, putative n=1 Tax=Aspergillus clavatus (strain ATCC 1007 / CBS 513.65 / DSM 816 / NCTC 3887 / NRRL 1 / QM 1276 / 107) TaxID=344612 RepID=A1CIL3_ASPCL|nr:L-cystine transporter, putative [Aspergillus clavatus NRRL 1]EAW10718.1 L-cystine transporter, putative [Aspergillus clavatus NRRL 1]